MSREIKFRAWDKFLEDYCEVLSINFTDKIAILKHRQFGISDPIDLDKLVIEQFTGLKDKNGKDIYENNILAWHSNVYRKHDWVGIVVYRGAGFVAQDSPKSYSSSEWLECACQKDANIVEIVGDVYENPELLEAGK